MLKKLLNLLLAPLGYQATEKDVQSHAGFQIYAYTRPDGSFDYDKYRQAQVDGNLKKIDNVWVREENVEFLAGYLRATVGDIQFGICHGTRRGKEQEWFRKYLACEVIGTEISATATQFPHTIQWDFHEVKPEWLDAVDFIYSNSLDHSYDPRKCLDAWMSCISPRGVCILEHSSGHERAHATDPFGAHISQMPYLVLTWGQGRYFVREILEAPARKSSLRYMNYIVIQRL